MHGHGRKANRDPSRRNIRNLAAGIRRHAHRIDTSQRTRRVCPSWRRRCMSLNRGIEQLHRKPRFHNRCPALPAPLQRPVPLHRNVQQLSKPDLRSCRMLCPLLQVAGVIRPDFAPVPQGRLFLHPLILARPVAGSNEYEGIFCSLFRFWNCSHAVRIVLVHFPLNIFPCAQFPPGLSSRNPGR